MILLTKRFASVVNYAKLVEKNMELGRFSYTPRPPFYLNHLERSPQVLELQKKPWKDLTREEAREIYFSYFPLSMSDKTKHGTIPFQKSPFFVFSLALAVFVFGNIFFDYLVRLWNWTFLYDSYMREMTHEKIEQAFEFYARVQGHYQYDTKLKWMRFYQDDIGYQNSTSDRSIFNPLKWFRDEEKRLALLKAKEEQEKS